MRILIAANHYPVASGRYMADAFRRLGHEVRTVGEAMGNDIWGMKVAPKYIWTPDSYDLATWPELVIVMDSDTAVWDAVKRVKPTCPVIVYGVDNHVRSYEDELFIHKFLSHYHGPAYPVDPNRADHTWLPCGYDPTVFTLSPIPWENREFDICLVGVLYPRRQTLVDLMREAGLKVFAATGLLYDEYRAAYQNSRISLCVSAAGDVAQRIFETAAMGCAILTDPLLDIMDEKTANDLGFKGYATYWSDAEAVTIAKTMLLGEPAFQVAQHTTDMMPKAKDAPMIPMGLASAVGMAASVKAHTWDARAQTIVDWFEREYGKDKGVADADIERIKHPKVNGISVSSVLTMQPGQHTVNIPFTATETTVQKLSAPPERKPFLNLGCGRTHLPGARPAHHALVPEGIYTGEQWVNVDRSPNVDADKVFDLFSYPWPLESDSYDGALLSHLCEHIPHEIKISATPDMITYGVSTDQINRCNELQHLQDGWFAFFAELYRVLRNGAEVHILSPHARSDGAISDPTHTRYLLPQSFEHSMTPNPDAPFEYATGGIHFEMVDQKVGVTGDYNHMLPLTTDPADVQQAKHLQLEHLARTQNNVIPEFYVRLKVVK